MANKYMFTDGVKSIDLPQYPNEAWHFYSEEPEQETDFYAAVSAVFRAINLTANATANIPFALVTKRGKDYDTSDDWQNKVGFMPNPTELIRLWRMSLSVTNSAYGFMERAKGSGDNLRYIVPKTITPQVDIDGLKAFRRTLGTSYTDYPVKKNCPIFYLWRLDHTTELLPSKATEFRAMMAAAGTLFYADYFVESFFKRGGIKPTMLVLKGMTTKDNIDRIEGIWDKVVRGYYKYLGKIFQGVDSQGGLEAQTIGEGVDTLKDQNLMNAKIADIAMAIGMPLSLLLSNSANYATAITEYKGWYENSLSPWCQFMAEGMTQQLFSPLGLRFEFRPEMTDPGQEDEVARAGAYASYINAGMKPSIAAQVVGIELPQGVEFDDLDPDEAELPAPDETPEEQPTTDNEVVAEEVPAKWIPDIDQLHELELWRKFAFRKLRKGESLDFAFEVRTLPDDIADAIREGLGVAISEDGIKAVFDFGYIAPKNDDPGITIVKSDLAILELADAINKAASPITTDSPEQQQSVAVYLAGKSMMLNENSIKLNEDNTATIMSALSRFSTSMNEQQAAIDSIKQEIEMNDANTQLIVQAISNMVDKMSNQAAPVIPAPIINVAAPEVTVTPPEVVVNLPKKRPINLSVVRNQDGQITGIQEK